MIHGGTGRIDLEVVPVGSQARLTVRDHGQGIPPDARELVFERFSRLDPERPGTGLGLAIARWIASHHDGTLSVEEASPGARFVLTLPLAPHGDTNLSASA